MKKGWLKAFFDDESHVPKDRNRIELSTINKKGMEQVKSLLNDLGIVCKLTGPYDNNKTNPNAKPFYRIRIYGEYLKKFAETIELSHPKKIQRLSQIIKKISGDAGTAQDKAPTSLPI